MELAAESPDSLGVDPGDLERRGCAAILTSVQRSARSTSTAKPRFAPALFSFHGETMATEKATFGAGCFWGVEATFRGISGVRNTIVGYAGGTKENPSYEEVCRHDTGHAEVVQVEFDPALVPYKSLLDVFWSNHDPTTLNRQGPDVGDQYRSVIFYHTPEQQAAAEESKAGLDKSGRFRRPIVTQILPAPVFYPAEDYHQRYLEKRGLAHCAI
jgi:peptide-methionine (S)-S-oxide reductase